MKKRRFNPRKIVQGVFYLFINPFLALSALYLAYLIVREDRQQYDTIQYVGWCAALSVCTISVVEYSRASFRVFRMFFLALVIRIDAYCQEKINASKNDQHDS